MREEHFPNRLDIHFDFLQWYVQFKTIVRIRTIKLCLIGVLLRLAVSSLLTCFNERGEKKGQKLPFTSVLLLDRGIQRVTGK